MYSFNYKIVVRALGRVNITNFSRDLKLGVKITFRPSKTRNIVGIYCI